MAAQQSFDRGQFGARLKAARTDRKLSQAKVGKMFGVEQSAVSRWETGDTLPDIATFVSLCDLYRVSVAAMLWGDEGMTPADIQIAQIREILGATPLSDEDVMGELADRSAPPKDPGGRRKSGG